MLFPGEYDIKLVHPQYPPFVKNVEISSQKITSIEVNLDTLFGYLDCHIYPWGKIYIDGTYKGDTPLNAPIVLTPGSHLLTVKNPEYSRIDEYISIAKTDTMQYKLNFEMVVNKKIE